jgi:prefoldin subunit 5
MNAIEYIKKYQDTKKKLDKMNGMYTDLVQKYMKLQNELEEAKKQVAGWSTMAGTRK